MGYPVSQLISEAFYTSGIVSREFQTVQGDQELTALLKLNEILTDTAIETDMIPFFTSSYTFPAVVGQEMYFIPNLDDMETLVFFINSIRYQMRKNPRDQYFGSGRAQNVESLPFNWHAERTLGGTNVFIYFFPDQQYPMQATGLFRLQQVSLFQDLNSPVTTANLGFPTFPAPVTAPPTFNILNAGELVVNGVDLEGFYLNLSAFIYSINNGTILNPGPRIPYVSASLSPTGQVVFTNIAGSSITITTTGNNPIVNGITFSAFSTTNGPLSQTFMAMVLDQYYINYLQYRLADRLCTAYNFILPPGAQLQLDKYLLMISKRSSPIDMTMSKISTLTTQGAINYAQINIGHGWTTG